VVKKQQQTAKRADRQWVRQGERLAASSARVRDLEIALNEHSIVAITDSKGIIKYVNNKFCSISKYTREELIGQNHRIINSSYHDKSFFRDLWKTIQQGQVWKGELRNRAKDGSFYWVATTIVPFADANGVIHEFVSIRTDITERKNAELALRESEAKLQALFDTMTEGLALNEAIYGESGEMIDYRILAVNKAFYSLADYRGKLVVNRFASDLYGMSHDEIKAFWLSHRDKTESVTTEYTSPISKKVFLISTSPIIHGRFVTSFLDITERTEIKQKLKDSEAFLRNMANSLPVLVAYWLPDYTCKFANKAYGEWLGRPVDELLGKHARQIIGDEAFEARVHIYETVLRSGETRTNTAAMRTADGKNRQIMTSFLPDVQAGQIVGMFAVTSDIT